MFVFVSTDTTSPDNGGTIIVNGSHRYYRDGNKEPLNILWFGAIGNGSTDNTTQINNALAALPINGGVLHFPSGKYLIDSAISYTYPSIYPFSLTITGDGQGATNLYWPNANNGFSFTLSDPTHSIHVRNIYLGTGKSGTEIGILVNQTSLLGGPYESDFTNVTFGGGPTQSSGCWDYAIKTVGLSFANFIGVVAFGQNTSGNGVWCAGNGSLAGQYAIVINLTDCSFIAMLSSFIYGDYLQGVTLSQCNFGYDANGVGINVASGALGVLSQLTVIGCQFGGEQGGNQISIQSPIAPVYLIGNLIFIPPTGTGIAVFPPAGPNLMSIIGNTFNGQDSSNGSGINVLPGCDSSNVIVSGNQFVGVFEAIILGSGTSNWNVQGNSYSNVGTKVSNSGTGNSIGVATD